VAVDERLWKIMQRHLGYSDEELKIFRENPGNEDVLSRTPALMSKLIVLQVVASHGCNSHHKLGDQFYFDGAGNLLTDLCPKKVCAFLLGPAATLIYAVGEMVYAGVDPNVIRFKRTNCFDVGLQCGGWGRVVVELRVEDRSPP
jgi:hypothetical protein